MKYLYSIGMIAVVIGAAFLFRYDISGSYIFDRWTNQVYQHYPLDNSQDAVSGKRYWFKSQL